MRTIKRIIFSDQTSGETTTLTFNEFHEKFSVDENVFLEMLEYSLIEPVKQEPEVVYLDLEALHRMESALRLQEDLGINISGAALALELLDEISEMRSEVEVLRRHLQK